MALIFGTTKFYARDPPKTSTRSPPRASIEALTRLIDPAWLARQAQRPYRLGPSFLEQPLHLVSGTRIEPPDDTPGPQRLARMLLVCRDFLRGEPSLDFFNAATLVPEVAILGTSLAEIHALGPEAQRKLAALPTMDDDHTAATVYELLVGAACIRKGLDIQMVPEDRTRKVPDYRLNTLGAVPSAIECKRRLGLTSYERGEAQCVDMLYKTVRATLRTQGHHCAIEAVFSIPLSRVSPTAFHDDVLRASNQHDDHQQPTSWGTLAVRRLPFSDDLPPTTLYSPDYLERVFRWAPNQGDWDGLLGEVEVPLRINVKSFKMPMCLKWRSESGEALTKKARGITSLWADAVKQLPDGEIGFVYIAYPEGARPVIADARTRHILTFMARESWHRWSVRVPATVISRLYARALGSGMPDLIENSLPWVVKGQEFWLTTLPLMVLTRQFE